MVPYSNGELAQMEQAGRNAERCVCCGAIIPEGRQVCLICELNVKNKCDLVEVVYCKDCRFECGDACLHALGLMAIKSPKCYCAYGERRKDNE